jgi:RNA polymerase sigma-32 factor
MSITYRDALNEPLLTVQQERDAIRKWQDEGDQSALELLIRSHARQAYAQAIRWTDNPAHLEDLVAEGMIGLMRAAGKFDLSQDVRFSTYAAWWVMTSISAALVRVKSVIDMPPRTYLDARMGRLNGEEAHRAQMAIEGAVALEAPAGEGSTVADRLGSPELTPEEVAAAASSATALARIVREAMDELAPQERGIIQRRKLQPVPDALEDLATEMGLSRDRLRQIEARAINRLRRGLVEKGFSREMLD